MYSIKLLKTTCTVICTVAMSIGVTHAALVEVLISGSTDGSDGSIVYAPGSTFTARAIYDTSVTDRGIASVDSGFFYDPVLGETALVSFELSTNLGTVNFATADIVGPSASPAVQQAGISPLGQTVITYYLGNSSAILGNGFSGSIDGMMPHAFTFSLNGSGPNNYFFTDPNELFSGVGTFSTDATFLGGSISVQNISTGASTILGFGDTYSISAVPVPAAVWLFSSGLIGLIGVARRKKKFN